jgi:hypothetical protein
MPLLAFLAPWLESLAVTLVAFLSQAVVGLVGKVLVGLAIGSVTVTGFNALFSSVLAQANIAATGNAQFEAALSAVGIPWFVSTMLSAVTTKLALKGLKSDSLTSWRMSKGSA